MTYVEFLSTLSLRRATSGNQHTQTFENCISIHALLAESDTAETAKTSNADTFLSTLSLRRATRNIANGEREKDNFYPRSPCGERQPRKTEAPGAIVFLSTLSLRRATIRIAQIAPIVQFLSTLSLRRATSKHCEQ